MLRTLAQAWLYSLSLLLASGEAHAEGSFVCASALEGGWRAERAGKPVALRTAGTRQALVLFAHFADEEGWREVPDWGQALFDGERPGSFAHFYRTMSFGRLDIEGEVAPRAYASSHPAFAYLAASPAEPGAFGHFSLEILRQADLDIDFSRFDSDGPDGAPNSGDDDGYADAVFIVMASTPRHFLLGSATGTGWLGFAEDFVSGDIGASGKRIRVSAALGTLQQGRTFAEAAGTLCHEYGHVLGLPDLFNADFLQSEPLPGPEEDSAGMGAWGLLGWGALGWKGDDGPTSFSGWSRAELGWTQVVEATRSQKAIRLEDVGTGGSVYRVPVGNSEYFLLENRRRSTHYDRHIPAEGLLVWHVYRQTVGDRYGRRSRWVVDLECADGRWADAGYPLGQVADPLGGEDNLDFWAHDPAYAQAHAGNLGDASDPFAGARFRRFAPDTNPASTSVSGHRGVRFEDIRFVGDVAFVQLETEPLFVELQELTLRDQSGDGAVEAGEISRFAFQLVNRGGLAARHLRTVLSSGDSLVQVLSAESDFADLGVDQNTRVPRAGGFPSFLVADAFAGTHTVELALRIFAGSALLDEVPLLATAVSARQRLLRVGFIDTLGNGDGQAQKGEFVRPELSIEVKEPALLPALRFSVRALSAGVEPTGSPAVIFDRLSGPEVRSVHAPEFLLSSDLKEGTLLGFELEVEGSFSVWRDTFQVEVAAGEDRTPPRVGVPLVVQRSGEVVISLGAHAVRDGGVRRRVEAIVYEADATEGTAVPLRLEGGVYAGVWRAPAEGIYRVEVLAEDAWGNQGRSAARLFYFSFQAEPPISSGSASRRLGKGEAGRVAYSPEGGLLAVAGSIGTWLYEASTLRELGLLEGHEAWVTALAFSADGQWLATGSNDRTVRLWNVEERQERDVLEGHTGPITALAFSADGQWLASSGWDSTVVIWKVEPPARWKVLEDFPRGVVALDWSGPRLAAGDWSGILWWWDGEQRGSWQGHSRGINDLAFSPDGRLLASAGSDGVVHLRNVRDGHEEATLQMPGGNSALAVRFSADSRWLATASADGVWLWDAEQHQRLERLPESEFAVYMDWSTGSQRLVTMGGYPERYVRVWDVEGLQVLADLEGFTAAVNALALSPDGGLLAVGHRDDTIGLWERARGQRQSVLRGHSSTRARFPGVSGLAFTPDGKTLISTGGDGTVRLWAVERGEMLAVLGQSEEYREVSAATFSPDGRLVATQEPGSKVRLWDLAERREIAVLEKSFSPLAFSPDGRLLAYGGYDQLILRDVIQGREIGALERAGFRFVRIAFSPDGRLLAAVGWLSPGFNRTQVRLWDLEHLREIGALGEVEESVLALAFSADGRWLAVGEAGGRIRVWDVFQQRPVKDFKAHNGWVRALVFAPEGVLVSGGEDGVVRVWPLEAITAVSEETAALPRRNTLLPAYPNPFNASVSIPFELAEKSRVRLRLYNLAGQVVRTLELGVKPAGAHVGHWDGRDEAGALAGSGVYFYRLEAGEWTAVRRMVLVK